MKKFAIPLLVLVLTAAFLTGCGCRNTKPMNTVPTTVPVATMPTTMPTTQPTVPSSNTVPDPTLEDGNGPLPTNATAGPDGITDDLDPTEAQRKIGSNYSTAPTGEPSRKMPHK